VPDSTSQLSNSSRVYAELTTAFTGALLEDGHRPILPAGTILNVNLATSAGNCASASDYKFVFTRVLSNANITDVLTCGSRHLPDELTVVNAGCYVSVSVLNATIKADVDSSTQKAVYNRFSSDFFSCFSV
jgi:5'-nucleotidase